MALATFATPVAASASPTEQNTVSRIQQMTTARGTQQQNPMAGAELDACVHGPEHFERGVIDTGTFNDGMRILSSIGSYYFERNFGPVEERLARADRYDRSLENCSADDLRVAAYFINTWFPELQTEGDDILAPLTISSRAFATAEIRRRLGQAIRDEGRSGV